MWRIVHLPVQLFFSGSSVVSAFFLWDELGEVYWWVAPTLLMVGSSWGSIVAYKGWHDRYFHRCGHVVLDTAIAVAQRLDFRAANDRATYVYGFMRVAAGQPSPPDPSFSGTRSGARVKRPWQRSVPQGTGSLWVAKAFAYPNPLSGVYGTMPCEKAAVIFEYYGMDGEQWERRGRHPSDRYARFTLNGGAGVGPFAIRSRARTREPEWLRLASIGVHSKEPRTVPVPPMLLSAVRRLRIVFEQSTPPSRGQTLEATFSLMDRLKPVAAPRPDVRLYCTLESNEQSATLAGLKRMMPQADRTFAIDFLGNPETGVVRDLYVEGIAGPDFLYRDGTLTIDFQ